MAVRRGDYLEAGRVAAIQKQGNTLPVCGLASVGVGVLGGVRVGVGVKVGVEVGVAVRVAVGTEVGVSEG